MRKLLVLGMAIGLLAPVAAFAQSPFSGTWQLAPAWIHLNERKPLVLSLEDGVFTRSQVGSDIKIPADGRDHAVKSGAGFSTISIKVINGHSYKELDKKAGKVVVTALVSTSSNGKILTVDSHGADGAHWTWVYRRTAGPRSGSNAVSGVWSSIDLPAASVATSHISFTITGNTVTASNAQGTFTATVGGQPVPYVLRSVRGNGLVGITVAVAMPTGNVLRETWYVHGSKIATSTFTIQPGGQTLKTVTPGWGDRQIVVMYRK